MILIGANVGFCLTSRDMLKLMSSFAYSTYIFHNMTPFNDVLLLLTIKNVYEEAPPLH